MLDETWVQHSTLLPPAVNNDFLFAKEYVNVENVTVDAWNSSTGSILCDSHVIDDDIYPVSASLVALLSTLYGLIAVTTIVGNALVIAAIIRYRHMQTVTNFFIANLSVADELIGIFSVPFQFQAALLQRWNLPVILCPVAPFVKEMSVCVSVWALVIISVDRYMAVLRPLRPRTSGRLAVTVMAAVWTIAFIAALPSAIVFRVVDQPNYGAVLPEAELDYSTWHDAPTKPVCIAQFPSLKDVDGGAIYRLVLAVIQYFLPLGVISFTYASIMHHLWLNKTPGTAVDSTDRVINRNKRKVIKMLTTVVCLFAICWLPLQTYNFTSEIFAEINLYRYINIVWFCFNWLAMSNSCYNPFVYGLLNDKFQRSFKMLFASCCNSACSEQVIHSPAARRPLTAASMSMIPLTVVRRPRSRPETVLNTAALSIIPVSCQDVAMESHHVTQCYPVTNDD